MEFVLKTRHLRRQLEEGCHACPAAWQAELPIVSEFYLKNVFGVAATLAVTKQHGTTLRSNRSTV